MSDHQGHPLTQAISDALANAGLRVGVGVAPKDGGWSGAAGGEFHGYVVVHPTPGGVSDGTIDDPWADAQPDYTITAVGSSVALAEQLADQVRSVMLSAALTVPGRTVSLVVPDGLAGAVRDNTVQPHVWFAPGRFSVMTTPA